MCQGYQQCAVSVFPTKRHKLVFWKHNCVLLVTGRSKWDQIIKLWNGSIMQRPEAEKNPSSWNMTQKTFFACIKKKNSLKNQNIMGVPGKFLHSPYFIRHNRSRVCLKLYADCTLSKNDNYNNHKQNCLWQNLGKAHSKNPYQNLLPKKQW